MTRRHLSTRARLDLFQRWNGVCHICEGRIQAGEKWEAEHVIPLAQGGEDGGDNLRPAHVKCHKAKSASDATNTARAIRRQAFHIGAKAASRNPIPGSRNTKWKRKMNGEVVPR